MASFLRAVVRFSSLLPQLVLILPLAADKMIKIWSVFTGQIVRTLLGHSEGLSDIAWSGDSKYLASASDDKTIRIWDVDHVRQEGALSDPYS